MGRNELTSQSRTPTTIMTSKIVNRGMIINLEVIFQIDRITIPAFYRSMWVLEWLKNKNQDQNKN
jgi:hypothetical protein